MSNNVTQSVLLRRSNLAGKVPTTDSLHVGEIGLNTYDGRAFMHKSGSTDEIVQLVVTGAEVTGSINILGTGSFGQLEINGNANFDGAVSGNFTGSFQGDGSNITGVTASMRPDDFDFNSEPFAGTIGYIQATGSLYKVASVSGAIEFRYNDIVFANITTGSGFSGSVYGIGDVLSFSSSVYTQFAAGPDAGVWA
jgi:hypothetical protein